MHGKRAKKRKSHIVYPNLNKKSMNTTDNMKRREKTSFAHSRKNDQIRHFFLRIILDSDMILRIVKGGVAMTGQMNIKRLVSGCGIIALSCIR